MIAKFYDKGLVYSGAQLRGHFVRSITQKNEDGIVAFIGPAEVCLTKMVDLDDRAKTTTPDEYGIRAAQMIHFICEHFETVSLTEMNWRLRLFITIIASRIKETMAQTAVVIRRGDDLFIRDVGKLTVAVATKTIVSTIFHVGINIDPAGAPVKAAGLQDYFGKVTINRLICQLLTDYVEEVKNINMATRKVEPRR